jgi:hypothetical protein
VTAISRYIIDWDDKGFPCLADDCPDPKCGATALIINEWNAIECLSCSWREFEPDDARADYDKWPDESRAIDPEWTGNPPRGRVTAVLGRAALLAVVVASLLWTAYSPPGAWKPAWVLLAAVVVSCAVPAWIALQPENERRRA